MRIITFGFSKSKKLLPVASWVIRAYQGFSEFSHIYTRIHTKKFPSDIICHASEGKVLRMSGTQFDKRHQVIEEFSLEVSDELYRKAINKIHEISGADYSVMQNLGIVFVHFLRLFGVKKANPFQSGWNCSEFCFEILKELKPELFVGIDPQTVLPIDLHRILTEMRDG